MKWASDQSLWCPCKQFCLLRGWTVGGIIERLFLCDVLGSAVSSLYCPWACSLRGQLTLNVLWRGTPSSLSKDFQKKLRCFFINTHWRHFSLPRCLLMCVFKKKRTCFKHVFASVLQWRYLWWWRVSSLFYISESDACSLLHIRRAGRSANGVWEISVLYPQGPVLCTWVTTLALIVYGLAWAWIFNYFFPIQWGLKCFVKATSHLQNSKFP